MPGMVKSHPVWLTVIFLSIEFTLIPRIEATLRPLMDSRNLKLSKLYYKYILEMAVLTLVIIREL